MLVSDVGMPFEDGYALIRRVRRRLPAQGGVVPAVAVPGREMSDPAVTVEPVRRLWRRLGLPSEGLRGVVVTPTCGMAGADPAHVLAALRLARAAAGQLADDPEA